MMLRFFRRLLILAILLISVIVANPRGVSAADDYFWVFTRIANVACYSDTSFSAQVDYSYNTLLGMQLEYHIYLNGDLYFHGYAQMTTDERSFTTFPYGYPAFGVTPYVVEIYHDLIDLEGKLTSSSVVHVECPSGAAYVTYDKDPAPNVIAGPPLPDDRDLRLVNTNTAVLDAPNGTPIEGAILHTCETVYIVEQSADGKFGHVFMMGGWIPMQATQDIAEDYGQPGGQSRWLGC